MTIVDCAVYSHGERREGKLELQDAYEHCARDDSSWVWIGLHQPSEEEFRSVREEFNLHPLAVEDAIKAHQRPKLEEFGDSLFLVLKPARYIDETEEVEFGEILIFMGEGYLITVRHGDTTELHDVRVDSEKKPEKMKHGPAAVLHAIMDRIVDDYTPVVEGVEDDIEEVEEDVFSPDRGSPAQRIYHLKREVLELHRATAPLLGPLDRLANNNHRLIPEKMRTYFRDVHDHAIRIDERVEGFRDMLNSVLSANLTQVAVRQNEDMRRISAWVAIIAVPTAIAGIYGMNFDHMPELRWELGYPGVLLVMLSICTGLYAYFKKAGWL
jgi:magnesium transporter